LILGVLVGVGTWGVILLIVVNGVMLHPPLHTRCKQTSSAAATNKRHATAIQRPIPTSNARAPAPWTPRAAS
jgi:hypothetical protein